jgi:hypothetical protein
VLESHDISSVPLLVIIVKAGFVLVWNTSKVRSVVIMGSLLVHAHVAGCSFYSRLRSSCRRIVLSCMVLLRGSLNSASCIVVMAEWCLRETTI